MSQQLFLANTKIKGDEVGITQVEQATTKIAQVKATYN
jgi:hypothetical protein